MKTAILFTGQLRTIQRTAKVLKENLIDPNNADVFIFCEERLADQQYGTQEPGSLDHLKETWGSSIKSLVVADEDPRYWRGSVGDNSTDTAALSRDEYRYERASSLGDNAAARLWYESTGAALEYYQLKKAYEAMCAEEERTGEKYDLVARSRFDVALFKSIKMANYFNPTVFWESIFKFKKEARKANRTSADLLFAAVISGGEETMMRQVLHGEMASVGYCGVINADNFGDCIRANSGDVLYEKYLQIVKGIDIKEPCGEEYTREFLLGIPGVFAIRYNVIYFTQRKYFEKVVDISNCVGEYSSGSDLDWCSENQFGMHLVSNMLLSLSYNSNIDEHYLSGIELGAITLDKDDKPEVFIPDELTWTCIRKTKEQMAEDWLNLAGVDTEQSAVEILT